jgi:hypothetical protein
MIIAKHHVRFQGKMYHPGEEMPGKMTDAEWKRLQRLHAIETIHDPVAAVIEEEQLEPDDDLQDTADSEQDDGTEDTALEGQAEEAPMPEEVPPKVSKPAKQTKRKTKDLPAINAADLVVHK